jgi:hypothetical protein
MEGFAAIMLLAKVEEVPVMPQRNLHNLRVRSLGYFSTTDCSITIRALGFRELRMAPQTQL